MVQIFCTFLLKVQEYCTAEGRMEKTSTFLKYICFGLSILLLLTESVLIVYLCKNMIDISYLYLCTVMQIILLIVHFGFYKVFLHLEKLEQNLDQNKKDK